MALPTKIKLTPGKRILFLTKDLDLIKKQLYEGVNLRMEDLRVEDLLDDINTDTMTPAWVCFSHKPEDIALDAYAGLMDKNGERVFKHRALLDGNFEVIVSGLRKGTGSSRETAPQCEKWSGIWLVIAASFAPIHERNNINLGQLMGDHEQLKRLQAGETLSLADFTGKFDPVTRAMLEAGGLFPFSAKVAKGEIKPPKHTTQRRGMNMAEKLIATHLVAGQGEPFVKPGDAVLVNVDAGYSHEFTTAQVHYFLEQEYGKNYTVKNPSKFAVFEDHLLYATGVKRFAPFEGKIQTLRDLQREFQKHTNVRDYSAKNGVSPGICHQVAREHFIDPGDFVQATDSPHLHGRRQQLAELRRGRNGVRRLDLLGLHVRCRAAEHSIQSDGQAATRRDGQRRDAVYPRQLRQARANARSRDGIRRPRPCHDLHG